MQLHLLRHGIAIDRDDPSCPPEADRFLTKKGARRTRAAARGLAALGVEPDAVLSSPYRRARQTAEIACAEIGVNPGAIRETEALLPEADPDAILAILAELAVGSVLCAGHAPNLDEVVARVAGCPRGFTSLKKAGLASLALASPTPGCGELVGLYPTSVLRQLGDA